MHARLLRQLDELAEPELGVAGGRGARGPRSRPARAGRSTRMIAAWISSSREFMPTCSNDRLSREPWNRSMRTRSATSRSRSETMPASPIAGRFLLGKNENVAASPNVPRARPSQRAPYACAASSISARPCRSAISRSAGRSAGWPHRCTATIGPRALGDRRVDRGRVEVERGRVDVGEHRAGAGAGDRLGRGVERVGGADDLVARADQERPRAPGSARRCRWRRRRPAGAPSAAATSSSSALARSGRG